MSPWFPPDRNPRHRRLRLTPRHLLLLFIAAVAAKLALACTSSLVLRNANALGRRCALRHVVGADPFPSTRPRIAIVTLSDEGGSAGNGRGAGRSFRGVMAAAGGNKRAYAAAWGYDFAEFPAGDVDRRRPPTWSKILAVKWRLRQQYDWVFWNDADTLVTNPNISLESILLEAIGHGDFLRSPDLILTEDFNGINAGVFFTRRSEWSERFLETWWNLTSFVHFGSTRSGDNCALKHFIQHLPPEELQQHVLVTPMQCLFNSYPWVQNLKSIFRLIFHPQIIWRGVYSEGDFMIHFAGLDDKLGWTAKILAQIRNSSP